MALASLTTTDWLIIGLLWLAGMMATAGIASVRGHNVGTYLAIGLILSPLVSIIGALVVAPKPMMSAPVPAAAPAAGAIAGDFCPGCGKARMAGAAFCPSCGTAYASPDSAAVPRETVPEASTSRLGTAELAVIALIVIAVAAGIYVLVAGNANSDIAQVRQADAPPAGQIWFGETYDPTTFALSGRSSSTYSVSRPVAMVAGLSRRATASEAVSINISSAAAGVVPIGLGTLSAGDSLLAYLIPALQAPGAYPVTVTDLGGNVLASGTLVVQ